MQLMHHHQYQSRHDPGIQDDAAHAVIASINHWSGYSPSCSTLCSLSQYRFLEILRCCYVLVVSKNPFMAWIGVSMESHWEVHQLYFTIFYCILQYFLLINTKNYELYAKECIHSQFGGLVFVFASSWFGIQANVIHLIGLERSDSCIFNVQTAKRRWLCHWHLIISLKRKKCTGIAQT